MNETLKSCPHCGTPIPDEAPQGLCPKCLMAGAASPTEPGNSQGERPKPPSVEHLAPLFPHLDIIGLIGQGGMGFVFKARQPKLDRLVALKILPEKLGQDPAFAERFAREGRLLARLNHPNIVSVFDFGQADGFFYLLMEHVDGVNLREAMRAGRFTPAQALGIVPKICEALQFAHEERVLHRDIKPENILLDAKGRVKIADFGIGKLAGPGLEEPGITGTGAALGTPHYMAPEQLEKPSSVDHRADIYSLGVVFYEMLTGELPLGRFAPPSEKSEVNARVDEIVLRALRKERELRQQSAAEMKTEVETVSDATRHSAGRSPVPERAAKPPVMEALKTAPCLISNPGRLHTWKGRGAHPFIETGHASLTRDHLLITGETIRKTIALQAIRKVELGQFEWWSLRGPRIAFLSITFEENGASHTIILKPVGHWPEMIEQIDRYAREWAEALRRAATPPAAAENVPGSPSTTVPAPPRWLSTAAIAAIPLAIAMIWFGRDAVTGLDPSQLAIPSILGGFTLISFGVGVLVMSMHMLFFFLSTRSAVRNGHWKQLAQGGPPSCVFGSYQADFALFAIPSAVILWMTVAMIAPMFALGAVKWFAVLLIAGWLLSLWMSRNWEKRNRSRQVLESVAPQ